jgi:hypothetical protein
MSAPARDTPATTSASGFADGFGCRQIAFAREDGAAVERLYLRPTFLVYERALRETVARLGANRERRIVGPGIIERNPDGQGLVAVSPFVSGERLGDLLESAAERARDGEPVSGIDVAIGFLLDVLPALGALRASTGLSHGAIAPSRCVFTPDGSVVLTECGFAAALQRMNASRERLWREFGVAVPPMAGAASFDETCDVSQAALLALTLMVGRPLAVLDPIDVLPEWIAEAVEIAQIRGSVVFSVTLQRFLQRALPLPGRRAYPAVDAALQDVRPMAAAIGEEVCRAALAEFVRAASGTLAAPGAWSIEQPRPAVPEAAITAHATVAPVPVRLEPAPLEAAPPEPVAPEPVAPEPVAPEPVALEVAAPEIETAAPEPVMVAPAAPEPVASWAAEQPAATAEPGGIAAAEEAVPVQEAPASIEPLAPEPVQPEPPPAPAPPPLVEPARRKRWRARRTDKLRSSISPAPPPKPEPIVETPPAPAPVPVPAAEAPLPAPFIERPAAALVPLVSAPAEPPKALPPLEAPPQSAPAPLVIRPMAAPAAVPQPVFTPVAAPMPDTLWVPPVASTPPAAAAQTSQPITVASLPGPTPLKLKTDATFLAPAPLKLKTDAIPPGPAPLKLKTDSPTGFAGRTARREQPRDPYPPYPATYDERRQEPARSSGGLGRLVKLAAAAAVIIGGLVVAGRSWLPDSPSVIAEAPRTEPVTVPAPPPVTTGVLVVQTQPAGARVLLDGSAVGETPLRIVDVAPGRHVLTLITPTATVRRTVKVEAKKELTVDVPVFSGWVAIFAPIVLDVSEGGRALGSTDQGRLLLPPGRHTLTVTNSDFGYSSDHAVEIEAGEVRTLNLNPTGAVNLNAIPWAEVWVDGKKAGETPLANLRLPLGNREIVFKHPEFGERKMMTRITAGAPVAVSVDFSR